MTQYDFGFFLSRVFGGEVPSNMSNVVVSFLSRVFGGEADVCMGHPYETFLSRVFGGEDLLFIVTLS